MWAGGGVSGEVVPVPGIDGEEMVSAWLQEGVAQVAVGDGGAAGDLHFADGSAGLPALHRDKPGRELGYTKYHKMAEALGCHGEYVEEPAQIRPALERAFNADRPALVNVLTDWRARATTAAFSQYST